MASWVLAYLRLADALQLLRTPEGKLCKFVIASR